MSADSLRGDERITHLACGTPHSKRPCGSFQMRAFISALLCSSGRHRCPGAACELRHDEAPTACGVTEEIILRRRRNELDTATESLGEEIERRPIFGTFTVHESRDGHGREAGEASGCSDAALLCQATQDVYVGWEVVFVSDHGGRCNERGTGSQENSGRTAMPTEREVRGHGRCLVGVRGFAVWRREGRAVGRRPHRPPVHTLQAAPGRCRLPRQRRTATPRWPPECVCRGEGANTRGGRPPAPMDTTRRAAANPAAPGWWREAAWRGDGHGGGGHAAPARRAITEQAAACGPTFGGRRTTAVRRDAGPARFGGVYSRRMRRTRRI
jgi:hypothetical protein